ncbi:Gfo/Idh/MocA family protein [Aeromonas veronii]
MSTVAIIGCGNHVIKNILPVFDKLKWEIKYIVVRDVKKYSDIGISDTLIDDISIALADDSVDFIYIATPISTHYQYAKNALSQSFNVICEKPVAVTAVELADLNQISKIMGCNLYQVEMYKYHKQFLKLKEILASGSYGDLKQATFSFKIPHLVPSDIRYVPAKAGGALHDVGFYPISAAISLFPEAKLQYSFCQSEPGYSVNLHGVALLTVSSGVIVNCQWSIGSCYENKIVLDFPAHRIVVDRAFSKPPTLNSVLHIYTSNGDKTIIETGNDDQFFNMFSHIESNAKSCSDMAPMIDKTIEIMEAIFQEYNSKGAT